MHNCKFFLIRFVDVSKKSLRPKIESAANGTCCAQFILKCLHLTRKSPPFYGHIGPKFAKTNSKRPCPTWCSLLQRQRCVAILLVPFCGRFPNSPPLYVCLVWPLPIPLRKSQEPSHLQFISPLLFCFLIGEITPLWSHIFFICSHSHVCTHHDS